jgi:hypothetical protein
MSNSYSSYRLFDTLLEQKEGHLYSRTERLWQHALGYRIRNTDPEGRYTIAKDIITHPYEIASLHASTQQSPIHFTFF